MGSKYDFSGWATKNDLKCSDGRTIRKDAFKDNDGHIVPLVWNHQHNDPSNVLGHALLENKDNGVYAYCTLNETEAGQNAKMLIQHGDVTALSIYANGLKQKGSDVLHGAIREVSLVLAGANPGAYIDSILAHGESSDEEAIIYTDEEIELSHSDDTYDEDETLNKEENEEMIDNNDLLQHADEGEKTVEDVFNSLTDEQKKVVYGMIGLALEHGDEDAEDFEDPEGGNVMKHNVFDTDNQVQENTLSHDAMQAIIADGKRYGSLKESFLQHAGTYGIDDIEYLFPNDRNLNNPPEFIKRDQGWVSKVMGGVHHTPFSRIKSTFADITEDEARARGYIKGKLKKEEVFSLLKRSTTPQTIYKKQKLDRDDVIDIVDFDVVSWLKSEMRMMLDEELARAILIGDGRLSSDDDHIDPTHIRPVAFDDQLFTINVQVDYTGKTSDNEKAKHFIRTAIKARKDYKGSGQPTMFTTEDLLTELLLIEDENGRIIYDSVGKLETMLRVKEIVAVPVMEGQKGKNGGDLLAVFVNLSDYNVGADKGGAVSMFEDFDIDYNAQKYLIETRCSGALIKPYSAIAMEVKSSSISG